MRSAPCYEHHLLFQAHAPHGPESAGAVPALAMFPCVFAQTYPSKPITLVVPYAVGGATDILARHFGRVLSEILGQPVVIQNQGGAAGLIGIRTAVNALPDGRRLQDERLRARVGLAASGGLRERQGHHHTDRRVVAVAHCFITGGTRGIGAATALLAARLGHDLTLVARDAKGPHVPALVNAIRARDRRVEVLPADISREADIVRVFADAEQKLGPIGMLVNAAGMGRNGRVDALEASRVNRLFTVSMCWAPCCAAVRPRAACPQPVGGRGGSIVNVSSMAATVGGRPGASAYAASKAAVDVFTTAFAREVAAEGIRVNVVRPGVVETDMTRHITQDALLRERVAASIPMQRL